MRPLTLIALLLFITSTLIAQNNDNENIHPIAYVAFYEYNYEQPQMFVLDVNTNNILFSIESMCAFNFSPNKQFLTYSPQFGTTRSILNLSTGDIREISEDTLGLYWSPDSSLTAILSYNSLSEFERILTVYNLRTEETEEIARGIGSWSVRWVGDSLYFARLHNNFVEVYLWDGVETEIVSQLELPDLLNPDINLSPDARTIIIRSAIELGNVEREFYIVDIPSGEVNLLEDAPPNQQIAWHPNGEGFSFENNNHDLIFYDTASKVQEIIYSSDTFLHNMDWSTNGRYLSFNKVYTDYEGNTSHRSIYVYDTLTGNSSEIRNYVSSYSSQANWISETQFVYSYARSDIPHTQEDGNLNDLYLYDVTIDESRRLTNTPDLDEHLWCLIG